MHRFVPWSGEPAVVDFIDDHSKRVFLFEIEVKNCFSQVGRLPHQRPDRDQHVRINWGNIHWKNEANFTLLKGHWVQNGPDDDAVWHQPFQAVGPYDIGSFMHDDSWGFSDNGQPTITRTDGSTFRQTDYITDSDVAAINQMYASAPTSYPPPPPEETP